MAYLHLTGNAWKAHSLKSSSEPGPEQWQREQRREEPVVLRGEMLQNCRWGPRAEAKHKSSVERGAGQVCCAQQPGAVFWDCPSLIQQQSGPVSWWLSAAGCDSSGSGETTPLEHTALASNITFALGHVESATESLGCGNIASSPRAGCTSGEVNRAQPHRVYLTTEWRGQRKQWHKKKNIIK